MSSLSMAQLGYFGLTQEEEYRTGGGGAMDEGVPQRTALPPPPMPPKPDPIGAYLRAKERMAELQARMAITDPSTTIAISRPVKIDVTPPSPPVAVRMERTNGDLAKLALVGIASGLAVWALTRRK